MAENNRFYLQKYVNEYWAYSPVFTPEECSKIIEQCESEKLETSFLANDKSIDTSVRKGKSIFLNSTDNKIKWIFERCSEHAIGMNNQFFNFDLDFIELLQFTKYEDTNDHYTWHTDQMYSGHLNRKLSFSILLSDPESYTGGEMEFWYGADPVEGIKHHGMGLYFPSTMLHRVKPVTKGTRYSLVGWICGPRFK